MKRSKEKGKLKIDEKEAIMVRRIYSLYAGGECGLLKILYN